MSMHTLTHRRWLRAGALLTSLSFVILAACADSNTYLSDPLTSAANKWSTDSNCFFKSDGFHINASVLCFAPVEDVADAVATVTVKQISGDLIEGFGIIFRHPGTGNYYAFLIDGNGKWAFIKAVNGQDPTRIVDFTANAAIKSGLNAANTLKVKAVGTTYTFFVNGAQVGQSSDSSYTAKGSWGLSGQDGHEVVYSNFLMTKP
jgi:hypothetical protein